MDKEQQIIRGIGSKTGSAMWVEIDDLVKRWARRNPFGANWNMTFNQNVRDNLTDKRFASSYDQGTGITTRNSISIHPELMNYIETFYPKFFESKDNVRRFGNTYRMFKIGDAEL
jgi:hypothetical protein